MQTHRRAWTIFFLTVLAGTLAIVVTLWSHHRQEDLAAERIFDSHLQWLRLVTFSELHQSDYEHLRQFIDAWAEREPDITSVRVVAKNGFEIVHFERELEDRGHLLTDSVVVDYGTRGEATLTLSMRPSGQHHVANSVSYRIAGLFVVFALLAGVLLRQKLLRQDEARILQQKSQELASARAAVERLAEQNRLILDHAAEGIFGFDSKGICTFVNPAAARMLGLEDAGTLIGCNVHEAIHHTRTDGSPYPSQECPSFRAMRTGVPVHVDDEVFWRTDGSSFPVEFRTRPIVKGGETLGGVTTFFDISDRVAAEAELRKLQRAVDQSPVSIVITDLDGTIDYVNPSVERSTGYRRQDLVGQNVRIMKSGRNPGSVYADLWSNLLAGKGWTGEFCSRRRDGSFFWERAFISPIKGPDGRMTHYLAIKEDITRERELAEKIRYQAEYDALTGIPNRLLTLDRLTQAIAHARRNHGRVALLFVDLDNFKLVNDTLGHDVGDRLLVDAAQRLRETIREGDTVGRHGGDEFLVVVENVSSQEAAERVAREIAERFARPFRVGEMDFSVGASIGIAVFPDDGVDATALLRNADVAMYAAKEAGRNTFKFFLPAMNQVASARLEIERRLMAALDLGELSLDFQPQINLRTGRVMGAEALLRWDNPVLGPLSPDRFVPVAEQSGLIVSIGAWVMEQACREVRAWIDAGHEDVRVAVNVSPRQFRMADRDGDILDLVERLLARYQLPVGSLELEITEGLLINPDSEVRDTLMRLHERGVRLAMDDFGTGYSSLAYLRELPFSVVKIDRSFIRDIDTDVDDRGLVEAILAMAGSLEMETVAEGVETAEQLAFLQAHDCAIVQGYYYGRPMSAERFRQFIETFSLPPVVEPDAGV